MLELVTFLFIFSFIVSLLNIKTIWLISQLKSPHVLNFRISFKRERRRLVVWSLIVYKKKRPNSLWEKVQFYAINNCFYYSRGNNLLGRKKNFSSAAVYSLFKEKKSNCLRFNLLPLSRHFVDFLSISLCSPPNQ